MNGTNLLLVLNQVRDFFEQAANVLGTADAMMQKGAWKLRTAAVTADLSYSLSAPRQWMPRYLCRSYKRSDKPGVLGSISIVLGMFERDPNVQKRLTEPLICGSVFKYDDDNDTWQYEFSTWHLYTPGR